MGFSMAAAAAELQARRDRGERAPGGFNLADAAVALSSCQQDHAAHWEHMRRLMNAVVSQQPRPALHTVSID